MVNNFEKQPIPISESVKWWNISLVYIGIAVTLPLFDIMTQLSSALGFTKTLLAVICSMCFLGAVAGFNGYIGAKTKLSTYMITTAVFGKKIAKFINFVMAMALLCCYILTLTEMGSSLKDFFLNQFHINIYLNLLIAICGLKLLFVCVFGFKGVSTLSKYVLPLLLLLLYIMMFHSLNMVGFHKILTANVNNSVTFGHTVSMLIGGWICGASVFPDIARFARTPKDGILGGVIGFMSALFLVCLPCIVVTLAYGNGTFLHNLIVFSPISALCIILFASWITNTTTMYSTSLSLAVVFEKIKMVHIIIILCTIGGIIACFDTIKYLMSILWILATIFPSIAVINILHYLLDKNNFIKNDEQTNIRGIIAWIIGMCLALLAHFDIIIITTVPALDGSIICAISYILITKINNKLKNKNKH